MNIISHRGLWTTPEEQNTIIAFCQSFQHGFGAEIDIRDHNGKLVVSHDPPYGHILELKTVIEESLKYDHLPILAFNIKADGLQHMLKELLEKYGITNYFVFDMSIPETIRYQDSGLNYFVRSSELEPLNNLLHNATGVWLDTFFDHPYFIKNFMEGAMFEVSQRICTVSPELHDLPYIQVWDDLLILERTYKDKIMLCTDYPMEARTFFND